MKKPIRVFYSPLSGKFYATQHYKAIGTNGTTELIECTGEKFDVTQDIARVIVAEGLTFTAIGGDTE